MRQTIVGLVTPHVLRIIDLAREAETGINSVDWHVRHLVTTSLDDLVSQYNATELLAAYADGLEAAIEHVGKGHARQLGVLRLAADMAARRKV